MLSSPYLWSATGLLLFFAILWKFGVFKMILAALDDRGAKISAELAEAKRLRDEAQALLAQYEAKRKAAEAEAEAIITAAKDEAARIASDAEAKMADFVARRTKTADAKIAQAEAQAFADVRAAAAEAATKAAETVLRTQMAGKAGADQLARSLAEVKAKMN